MKSLTKRALCLCLSLILVFGLAACSAAGGKKAERLSLDARPDAPSVIANGASHSSKIAAPAPSPKSTQVERSVWSIRRDNASQPTTRAYRPPSVAIRPRATAVP